MRSFPQILPYLQGKIKSNLLFPLPILRGSVSVFRWKMSDHFGWLSFVSWVRWSFLLFKRSRIKKSITFTTQAGRNRRRFLILGGWCTKMWTGGICLYPYDQRKSELTGAFVKTSQNSYIFISILGNHPIRGTKNCIKSGFSSHKGPCNCRKHSSPRRPLQESSLTSDGKVDPKKTSYRWWKIFCTTWDVWNHGKSWDKQPRNPWEGKALRWHNALPLNAEKYLPDQQRRFAA